MHAHEAIEPLTFARRGLMTIPIELDRQTAKAASTVFLFT
jgi:hypothetical protein